MINLSCPNLFLESYTTFPINYSCLTLNTPSKLAGNYVQSRKRKEVIDTVHNNPYSVISNGRQVGITRMLCNYILYYSLISSGNNIAIVSPISRGYRINDIVTQIEYLRNVHCYNISYSLISKNCLEINGNKIYDVDEFSPLQGRAFKIVWCDDFAFLNFSDQIISKVLPVIEYSNNCGDGAKLILSSTPSLSAYDFTRIYKYDERFKKVHFPQTHSRFNVFYKDVEDQNMFINAMCYPIPDKKNNCIKNK